MPTDHELLRQFQANRCERAFEALVERHLSLARGVALRVTRSPEFASDVVQEVFAKLASCPGSVPEKVPLPAWLHRTSHSCAVNLVRLEERRRNREATAANLDVMDDANDDTEWEALAPVIDSALDSLKTADRVAILLRFYEQKSHAEIGTRLGLKEDTTRVRVSRALKKLRTKLGQRRVTIGTSALVASLHVGLAPKADAAAAVVAQEALATTSLAGSLASIALVKWVLFGAMAFLISGSVGFVIARRAGGEIDAPSIPDRGREVVSRLESSNMPTDLLRVRGPVAERLALAVDLWGQRHTGSEASGHYAQVMASFTPQECIEAIDLMDRDYHYNGLRHRAMTSELLESFMKADPAEGARVVLSRYQSNDYYWQGNQRLWQVTNGWGKKDASAARAWLREQAIPDKIRFELMEGLVRTASETDPGLAIDLLLEIPFAESRQAYVSMTSMKKPELREATLDRTASIADESDRAAVFGGSLLRHFENQAEAEAAFERMGFTKGDAVVPLFDDMLYQALKDPSEGLERVLDFAFSHSPELAHPHYLNRYVSQWLKEHPKEAQEWLAGHGLTVDDVTHASASFNLR